MDNPLSEVVEDTGAHPDLIWKITGTLAGILGAIVARKVLDRIRYSAIDAGDPATDPRDEKMSWWYALVWAAILGVGASVGRLAAQRIVESVWKRRAAHAR
jgi:Protein of unknown function (DUF4235)